MTKEETCENCNRNCTEFDKQFCRVYQEAEND